MWVNIEGHLFLLWINIKKNKTFDFSMDKSILKKKTFDFSMDKSNMGCYSFETHYLPFKKMILKVFFLLL